jgi:hypothetical protein
MFLLIMYQVPGLIAHQSKLVEVLDRYSLYYFVILLGYLGILLVLLLVGIWFLWASRTESFTKRFDSFFSKNQDYVLAGLLFVWVVWVIVNQSIFLPVKITRGVNGALYVFTFSLLLLYTPLVYSSKRAEFLSSLDADFLFSQILIPLSVFSVYCLTLSFFLPDGVNKVLVTRSAQLFLPRTIFLLFAYVLIIWLMKEKIQVFHKTKEKITIGDFVLPLLPLTPIVQYMANNSDILVWSEYIAIFLIFFIFVSIPIFVVPQLLKNTSSFRPLMFLGLAFSFLITNMASFSRQFKWHQYGSLKIQLLVLVGLWLVSWIIYQSRYRNLLYLVIALNFISSSIMQFSDLDMVQTPSSQDHNDNALVQLVDSKDPVFTPSIYLLIYDSYVINDTMLSYGIDNQEQEKYLEDQGFTIYPKTYSIDTSSIASMSRVFNVSIDYYGDIRRAVSGDGVVQNLLEKYGYKTYGIFPRDYFFWGTIPSYDYYFPGSGSSVGLLTKAIFIGELRFDIDFDVVPKEEYVGEKRSVFSNVADGPRFVDTHSYLPGHTQNSGVCRPNETDLYKDRLELANIEMREDLAIILENDPEAIVIVAGDHGPHLTKTCYKTGDEYDISEITRLDIQDRNGVFLAIRWPSSGFEEYDDFTVLQDLFPVIFAYIFEDPALLQSRIEPTTVNGMNTSGVEVSNGIIIGGVHDGEPLFP